MSATHSTAAQIVPVLVAVCQRRVWHRRRAWLCRLCAASMAVVGWTLCTVSVARAEPVERVHVAYQTAANQTCPTVSAYQTQIVKRTKAVQFVDRAAAARVFEVVVTRDAGGTFHGRLGVRDAQGGATVRQVSGATCTEVIDALALIAALALDPERRRKPPIVIAPPVKPPVAPPPKPRRRRTVAGGLSAGGMYGAAPNLSALAGVFVDVRASAFRVGVSAALARSSESAGPAKAEFTWLIGRIDLCRRVYTGAIVVAGCLRAEVGMLSGTGTNIDNATSRRRPWFAPAAGATVNVRLSRRIFGRLSAFAAIPMIRDRFLFEPDTTIHRAAAVVPELVVSIGSWFL